jgi:hypothetical protein
MQFCSRPLRVTRFFMRFRNAPWVHELRVDESRRTGQHPFHAATQALRAFGVVLAARAYARATAGKEVTDAGALQTPPSECPEAARGAIC